jgi:serine/threonine protein kinase/Tol biopolymer transport system component
MALTIGTQLGSHEITALLGKGGMGEVYRARDLKLKREVAIKILPEEFSGDEDRVSRFQREAEVLASLNHPNIANIYDLEEENGSRYLVLELVEGETLAERIARGSVPVEEALRISVQICEGLEAAHERGIVHRDLKPGNVKLTPDGKVKILDFGLAKAMAHAPAGATLSNSPTLLSGTIGGMILGTAAYMAPEQARGREADQRSDIFSLGCVLYEMVFGRQAFQGEDVSDVLASVMKLEPEWSGFPADLNLRLLELTRRCLAKDRKKRWYAAGDVREELEAISARPHDRSVEAERSTTRQPIRKLVFIIGIVAVIAGLSGFGIAYLNQTPADSAAIRFSVLPPDKAAFVLQFAMSHAISPDGRMLAFIAADSTGKRLLWVRPLDSLIAHAIAGTDDTTNAFWSPDSRTIGFYSPQGKMKKVDVGGGPPQTICDCSAFGATWGREGVILFGDNSSAVIERVSAAGGRPAPVTALDKSRQETNHRLPYFLPDGKHFLYLGVSPQVENTAVYVGSVDSKETKRLFAANSIAMYAPPGYLLFVRERSLMAQPFDTSKLQLTGDAFPIAEDIDALANGAASFSVSQNGTLSYRTGAGTAGISEIAWFDRNGAQSERVGPPGDYRDVSLSRDGKLVVVHQHEFAGAGGNLWVLDWMRGIPTRFTFDQTHDSSAVWSPDGDKIVYTSNTDLLQKVSSGAGTAELLLKSPEPKTITDWSSDGKFILYQQGGPRDLFVLPMMGADRKPVPFVQTKFDEGQGAFSPDGRWVAYTSNESGPYQVFVQPFPASGAKWQISPAGGAFPRWNRNGRELFYIAADGKLMSVPIASNGANFERGNPKALFDVRLPGTVVTGGISTFKPYDVSPDGQRFLVIVTTQDRATSAPLTVVVNWQANLKQK